MFPMYPGPTFESTATTNLKNKTPTFYLSDSDNEDGDGSSLNNQNKTKLKNDIDNECDDDGDEFEYEIRKINKNSGYKRRPKSKLVNQNKMFITEEKMSNALKQMNIEVKLTTLKYKKKG
jgi:hypothetical protein